MCRGIVFFLLASLVPAAARADTETCIESTAALYQAFADVDADDTGTVLFKLRTGTYTIGSDLVLGYRFDNGDPNHSHGKLTIRGGYNAGCTAQSSALGGTTLVAAAGSPKVDIELNNNSLEISTISSQNVRFSISNWFCYVHHYDEGNSITIRQSRLENTRVVLSSPCHSAAIRNSMLTSRSDNPNDNLVFYGFFWGDDDTPQSFTVVGSTLRNGSLNVDIRPFNPGGNPPQAPVKLQNSVFDNDGGEVIINGGDVFAIRNRYDSIAVANGTIQQNSNNLTAAPQLQASGLPSNSSPLVNAGSRFVDGGLPAVDLAANPREIGTAPDIGAFETAVNNIAVLTVTNTLASGTGSLAQAVASANAFNGAQSIEFDISGSCPRVITLSSTLQITDELRIKGATQPGTVPNSLDFGGYNGAPCIVLRAGVGVSDAINFNSAESTDDLEVFNVGFSGFPGGGVTIRSGNGHRLAGLQFGAGVGAVALDDVTFPIRVLDDASAVEIGGTDPQYVNMIGNSNIAIQLSGLGSNLVQGNAIGSRGLDSLGNLLGILVTTPSNVIDNNRIVLSNSSNLLINSSAARLNVITNNSIAGSNSHGVSIGNGAHQNRIGPDNAITSNAGDGIFISSGSRNQVRENRFAGNGGLGIDLDDDGVAPNDDDPTNTLVSGLANRLQNYPLLDTVQRSLLFNQVYVLLDGSLRTTPGNYAVDIYRVPSCDASGFGEGNAPVGSVNVDVSCPILTNGQCTEPFSILLPENDFSETDSIALTATGAGGSTSEFSRCYAQNPDFSISVSNGSNGVTAGTTTTYTIVARNSGFTPTGGERVRDTFPAACTSVNWTCTGASGGICTPSGSGNINDAAISLPVGARVTYTAACAISPTATGTLVNTATVSSARTDLTPANNTDTDSDPIIATTLSIGPVSEVEGTGGNNDLVFTVTATPTPQTLVQVDYASSNGSATAGSDYTSVSGTLSFAAGVATRAIRVPILTDNVVEGNETLTMTLSGPNNASINIASATGTLTNDDTATLSLNNVSIVEGNAGTTNLSFSATLSNPVQGIVTARLDTADGNNPVPASNATAANNDYVAVVDGNLSLASGTTLRLTNVQIVGDTVPESNEGFRLRLSGLGIPISIPAGAVTLGANGNGTINNDDGQATTTVITGDTPDPSLVGQPYTVTVNVAGSSLSPVGSVSISDGDATCNLTLSAASAPNSTGACALTSTTPGVKTLTASFTPGTSSFAASFGTAPHQVVLSEFVFADGFE